MTTYYPMDYSSPHAASPSYPHYVPAQYPAGDVMMPPLHRFTSFSSLPDPDVPPPILTPIVPSSPSYSITSTSSLIPTWPSPPTALTSSSSSSSSISSSPPSHPSSSSSLPLPPTSPFLPQAHYQSQLYSHSNFSVEIPFAHHDSRQGSGEGSEGEGLCVEAGGRGSAGGYSGYSTTSGEGSVESSGDPSPKGGKKRKGKAGTSGGGAGSKQRRTSSPLPPPPSLQHDQSSSSLTPPSQSLSHLSPSELKKVRHREIDAARRAREGAAISRLHSLIGKGAGAGGSAAMLSSSSPSPVLGSSSAAAAASAAAATEEKVKDKVGILEVVGDRLVELERLVEKLRAEVKEEREKHSETGEQLTKVTKQMKQLLTHGASAAIPVHSAAADKLNSLDPSLQLSPSAREYLHQLEQAASLYSLSFVHSSLILLILSVQTGKCVDANQKFCEVAGWTKDEVIGRPFCQTAAELFNDQPEDESALYPGAKDGDRTRADGSSSSSSSSPSSSQHLMGRHSRYACNKAELIALYTGKKTSITVVFRVVLAKGQVIDVRCRCWLGNGPAGEEAEAGGEDLPRTASHLIVQTTEEDIIVLS